MVDGWRRSLLAGRHVAWLMAVGVGGPSPAAAQFSPDEGESDRSREAFAAYVEDGPRIDGVLDEAFWQRIEPITDFRQRDPVDGAPATERTEVRIAYDENNLYFGLLLFDSEPELIRTSILHREGRIDQDDHVWIALDTYHDRRNAYLFEMKRWIRPERPFRRQQLAETHGLRTYRTPRPKTRPRGLLS